MAEILNLGTNGNWAWVDGKLMCYYIDENGYYEGVEASFIRNSPAYRTNKQDLLELMGVDIPRIDYSEDANGVLLTEDEATNYATYSTILRNDTNVRCRR